MNKQLALERINQTIIHCRICPVGKSGNPVVGEGSAEAEVVFVGEAPGKQEAASGRPFIGRSGQLLRSLIRGIGLKEEEVYITSPVKYLPNGKDGTPGGTPSSADIAHGRIHLMEQLGVIQPRIVVLLGRVAAEGVLQKKVKVVSEHGQVIEESFDFARYQTVRGSAQDKKTKFFLTLHPAAVLRFPKKYKPELEEDFRKLKRILATI
jgi:DNA polymerase